MSTSESEPSVEPTPSVPCPLCNGAIPPGKAKVITTYKRQQATSVEVCPRCAGNVLRELAAERPTAATYPLALVCGGLGGAIGAAVWAGIAAATEYEVGYVAVLVGFLTGFGVRFGARGARGQGLQLMSVALALVALVAAKYGIVAFVAVKYAREHGVELGYLDPRILQIFREAFTSTLSPLDALFVFLAVAAAYKVAAPSRVTVQG
jgi:hypothetical protein